VHAHGRLGISVGHGSNALATTLEAAHRSAQLGPHGACTFSSEHPDIEPESIGHFSDHQAAGFTPDDYSAEAVAEIARVLQTACAADIRVTTTVRACTRDILLTTSTGGRVCTQRRWYEADLAASASGATSHVFTSSQWAVTPIELRAHWDDDLSAIRCLIVIPFARALPDLPVILMGSAAETILRHAMCRYCIDAENEVRPFPFWHAAVRVWDDPCRHPWRAVFDDEGTPTRRTLLVDRGEVRGRLVDRQRAAALGLPPSGHAVRDAQGIPFVRPWAPSMEVCEDAQLLTHRDGLLISALTVVDSADVTAITARVEQGMVLQDGTPTHRFTGTFYRNSP
jgi:predicted Zn-dependent protease